jgi:hypothetical protein
VLSLTTQKNDPSFEKTELQGWAQTLKRWGLAPFVAAFLESGGAFATIAAQGVYFAEPILEFWTPRRRLDSLAKFFEDPQQIERFATLLREQK